jgi:GNAT superfamily N-acetyltransferase
MPALAPVIVRDADEAEVDGLAKIWFDGWRDAHLKLAPPELTRYRTLESFRKRLVEALSSVRVAGPAGAPLGFYMLKDDELNQLYVAAESRGAGVAAALIADAEARLRSGGVKVAWLGCAIGNERAARFYEKSGWHRAGTYVSRLETPGGIIPLEVWRYEKTLTA